MAVALAFLLDLALGDPPGWPHPVNLMAWVAGVLTRLWHRPQRPRWDRLAGLLTTGLVVGGTWVAATLLLRLLAPWPYLALLVNVWLLQSTLATRGLAAAGAQVYRALRSADLPAARHHLSALVGRDTAPLGEAEIVRAVVESVAENSVDGVISPLFFAFLGGAPLALAFKAASTLDSLYGYRRPPWTFYGWASARLDDILNFIPARLGAILLGLAAALGGLNPVGALKTWLAQGRQHPSPNSGQPEAAMAGALGISLGGPSQYEGRTEVRPSLGLSRRPLTPDRITEARRLLYLTATLGLGVGLILSAWRGGF